MVVVIADPLHMGSCLLSTLSTTSPPYPIPQSESSSLHSIIPQWINNIAIVSNFSGAVLLLRKGEGARLRNLPA